MSADASFFADSALVQSPARRIGAARALEEVCS
jgi:hypothetical protein